MARRHRSADARRLLEVAIRYAEHGWPVLPLHTPQGVKCSCHVSDCGSPGKHPRTRHGLHQATIDRDQVRAWWDRWPLANVGVATGSTSGLLVLDIDLPDGPGSLAYLESEHDPLPATCEQRTGSGGRQLLFVNPDREVGNRAAMLPGMDIRGEGGYVVVPPSLHTSGDRYTWVGRVPPAPTPGWLLAYLDRHHDRAERSARQDPSLQLPPGSRKQRYAAAALHAELAQLSAAVEGTRNVTLNRAAFSLGQLVATGLLDEDHVVGELERVANDIGLGATETRRTIASGLTAGLGQPRAIPNPRPSTRHSAPAGASLPQPVRRIGARRR